MAHSPHGEFFISVDVETAGPAPSIYSMLAIGACTVTEPRLTFYIELKPDKPGFQVESLASHGLSPDRLASEGIEPAEALRRFQAWVRSITPSDETPIFVGFNAAFDWMFVNDYFHRYLKENPFGHAALDIKSYFMGLTGNTWARTKMRHLGPLYLDQQALTHHALRDALDQAVLFQKMLAEARPSKETDND
jgi:ribonuclease T